MLGQDMESVLTKIGLSAVPAEVLESTYSPTCISLRYQVGYPNAGEEAKGGNGTVYITLDYGLTVDSRR